MEELKQSGVSNNPLVSVCVITFQHVKYIRECLDSILMQKTNFPFEVIIGEDESSDGTREICIKYAKKFPDKIKLFLRSRKDVIRINGKPSGRYNFIESLKSCKGKYIALCEGDDYWTDPLKLQKQADFLEKNQEYSICIHPVQLLWENNPGKYVVTQPGKTVFDIKELARSNFINTVSCMFRSNLQKGFPDWFYKVQAGDWGLSLINAQYGNIYCIDEVMAVYRINSSSTWINNSDEVRIKYAVQMLEIFRDNFPQELYPEFSKGIADSYYQLLELSRKAGKQHLKLGLLLRALKEEKKMFEPRYLITQAIRLLLNKPLK